MSIKEYKSELGKLYQQKHEEVPLRKMVAGIYSLFEFYISCGDKLPISVSAKDYLNLTTGEIERVILQLSYLGCVVEYSIEKRPNGDSNFVLIDLL